MADSHYSEFFTEDSLEGVRKVFTKHYPELPNEKYNKLIQGIQWKNLLIMQKVRQFSWCLHKVLPDSFPEALDIILRAAPEIEWWESISLPDYIGVYGHDHWELSMMGLRELTKYSSSEFAIRPFLIRQPTKTAQYLEGLTEDENEDVRRYASEGCRPRHPWGIGLPQFKRDPSPILPILEKLKNDESEYVRRSVANNLNDISKDNPDLVLQIAKDWHGKNSNTDWLVRHGCRTLLKQGNRRALELFGFGNTIDLAPSNFQLDKETLHLGDRLTFTYVLEVKGDDEIPVRLEYGIYYQKANGALRRKVWKISEKSYQPGSYPIKKRHHFVDRTTRKHYEGLHEISLIINGEEKEKRNFLLKK